MICDVCGRQNPDDLTYCQDCGRRLKPREPRVVPPTPPTGLPKIDLPTGAAPAPPPHPLPPPPPPGDPAAAAGAAHPANPANPAHPARTTGRLRPEAPVFSFAPPAAHKGVDAPAVAITEALPQPPAAPPRPEPPAAPPRPEPAAPPPRPDLLPGADVGPATVAVRSLCPSCAAENPPGYRFCVTCGGPLAKAARTEIAPLQPPPPPAPTLRVERAPQGAPSPAAPPQEAAPAVQVEALAASPPGHAGGAAPDKIVGAPVLDIAAARHTPVRLIECARCHGHCVAGTRFCKYCGASLEGERPSPVPVPAEGGRSPAAIPVVVAPTLAGALDAESPTGGTRVSPTHPEQVMTLPSSVETAGGARPSPGPVPQRPPVPARPGGSRPDLRAVRTPEGRLVVIVEDGSEGKTFPLSGRQIDVGRVEGDILLEDDLYVSPRHARLIPHEGTWILRDLGSANRIYLRIRKPHTLQDGDLLLLGLEVLQFQTVSDGERGLGQAIQHGTLLFGSPAIQRRARLCQRTVEGVVRDVYHLHRDETVIGRETGDIVFTSDPFLSRRHAMIRRNPVSGEFTLTDLDSSNGTYIAIREDVSLVNGDFVRIGQHLFRVDLS